jgi:hypothetical protein
MLNCYWRDAALTQILAQKSLSICFKIQVHLLEVAQRRGLRISKISWQYLWLWMMIKTNITKEWPWCFVLSRVITILNIGIVLTLQNGSSTSRWISSPFSSGSFSTMIINFWSTFWQKLRLAKNFISLLPLSETISILIMYWLVESTKMSSVCLDSIRFPY